MNILRPSVEISELTKEADKAREAEARKQEEARKAAAARKDDRGSLNLEQALLIALLVLIATASLFSLGTAVAAKYDKAAGILGTSVAMASPAPGTVAVQVVDDAGHPVPGATVGCVPVDGSSIGTVLTADAAGVATFTGQAFKDYTLWAHTWTANTGVFMPVSLTAAPHTAQAILTAHAVGGTVHVVVQSGGVPVAGAWVACDGWAPHQDKQTDAAGVATFYGVPWQGMGYNATSAGRSSGWVYRDFTATDTTLTLTLH